MALEPAFILMMAVSVVIGYLLGSINFGVVVSKGLYHEDVRTKGSGNAGTTNILRTYGKKAAALTLAGDMAKGAVAVWLCHWGVALLTGADVNGVYAGYLAAIGAVCGHLWPVWFGFKGGKGIAVAAGGVLCHCSYYPHRESGVGHRGSAVPHSHAALVLVYPAQPAVYRRMHCFDGGAGGVDAPGQYPAPDERH